LARAARTGSVQEIEFPFFNESLRETLELYCVDSFHPATALVVFLSSAGNIEDVSDDVAETPNVVVNCSTSLRRSRSYFADKIANVDRVFLRFDGL